MLYNIEVNRETTIIKKENIIKKIEKRRIRLKENVYTQAFANAKAPKKKTSETHEMKELKII